MFIAFVLILLFILMGVLAGTYSVFSPFTQNIGDVIDFNSAYYGAIAGIERANLVLKYKQPGFEGSGGFFGTTTFGPASDVISGSFGNITKSTNGLSRQIYSRTTSIPSSGDGNVDYLLSSTDSSSFNQLPYFTTEKLSLSIDNSNSSNEAYKETDTSDITHFAGNVFSGQFRLPPKVKTAFSEKGLCTNINNSACDPDRDNTFDEIAVNRKLKGIYNGTEFAILPNTEVLYAGSGTDPNVIVENKDTMLRESVINTDNGSILFGNSLDSRYHFNPIKKHMNTLTEHNIVTSNPDPVKILKFHEILNNNFTTNLEFSFGIVNLLYSTNGSIYPFLEYQLSFGAPVANRFYTIEGRSVVGNYNVKIIMKKSTTSDNPVGDFTVIF